MIDARAAATISGRGERQLIRDTNDNQKLLARGTNRDDLALAIGRRPSILIAAAVSPRLTRYIGTLSFNIGDVIALINMGIFAVYSACLRLRPPMHGLTFMTLMSMVACVASVPVMVVELLSGEVIRPSGPTIVAVVYTGLFTSVAAYLAWNAGVARLGAQRAGAFLHLVPLFGALLAVVILGEPPRWFHAAGLVLIVAGVTVAARNSSR